MRTTTKALTTRFGEIEYATDDVLTVRDGLLGFSGHQKYALIEHKEGSPFRWLQCLEEPALAFLIVDPFQFITDYEVNIPDAKVEELGLTAETPHVVYTIVTIPRGNPEAMTVNLAGPIIVNAVTKEAQQVVVESPGFSVKHPLVVSNKANTEATAA
ncbi:MAG: flagellar assembly protein FliW [Armatimonadetes bacterium]|nr:flagellar assembly protein FliW [Armatimonadota bacterium]